MTCYQNEVTASCDICNSPIMKGEVHMCRDISTALLGSLCVCMDCTENLTASELLEELGFTKTRGD